ncbi:MAG: hypothetical protein H7Y33_15320 [Cytophagales bacterium]|nr:hypothetical protein [Rhizobacter sp.]
MPLTRILAIFSCCLFTSFASAQSIEPAKDWQTADSAHFRVNYRSAWRAQAERVVQAAERAYPKVTKALAWEPRGRTEILLIDQYDLANGFSTPLPYNIIGVFLAPPDKGELLDNSEWLDLLLTHEFTHTVHLDKVRGVPGVLQTIFGRQPIFFPNMFEPGWAIEGLAVYNESEVGTGRGRLLGPVFEAWLRAEAKSGFLSLREINAGGRALPVSKSYLYGAYFYEFLARKYGPDAIYKGVDHYSGNPPMWPRLHTNPVNATGKTMDVLWDEFLVDLKQQVQERAQAVTRVPEAVGERLAGPLFGVGAVAALPGGATLAVLDDGVNHTQLVKVSADGKQTVLADVNRTAELNVAPDGRVLVAQPDICNWRYLAFDLYRLQDDGELKQLTHCARLRHAVQAGDVIVGLQQGQGRTRMVVFDAAGQQQRVLWEPPAEVTLIDLAASPDGKQVSVVSKREGDWRVESFDLTQPGAAPRLLFTHNAPVHALTHGPLGLEFIAVRDGVFNVWRLEGDAWVRLSHSHTRVVSHGGTQADGSLALTVVAPGGYELRRMAATAPLQRVPTVATATAPGAASAPVPASVAALGEPQPYQSWRSMYPRTWFPVITGDRGLVAVGASTFGSDALGWHQYAVSLQYEARQNELLGSLQYLFQDQHLLTLQRDLSARAWKSGSDQDDVTSYDRNTRAQWLSVLPWLRLDRRIAFGVGAALDHVERVHPEAAPGGLPRTERLLAALFSYDTSGDNWWSEGANRGQHATLLYESYRPFARDGRNDYDGSVLRFDWRGFVPVGRSVLALRHTEAYARGFTERFQLGGAIDPQLQLGMALNNRDITLRGYRGDESRLRGANARVTSIEWRMPVADVDRHFMVPAVGLNRVSATAFFDIGGAWDAGHRPDAYQRGVGLELLSEVKLLYALGLQLRMGVARGLDEPKGTRGYLAVGRAF